jgi:two-component system, chemotaxis family, chemotaxis protein CheY
MIHSLVIDDDPNNRDIAEHMLTSIGYEVAVADSAQAGLDSCRRNMPTLILLDWYMPTMDGLAFLDALRSIPSGYRPKVVLCTAEGRLQKVIEALGHDANGYLVKPFSKAALVEHLEQIGLPIRRIRAIEP